MLYKFLSFAIITFNSRISIAWCIYQLRGIKRRVCLIVNAHTRNGGREMKLEFVCNKLFWSKKENIWSIFDIIVLFYISVVDQSKILIFDPYFLACLFKQVDYPLLNSLMCIFYFFWSCFYSYETFSFFAENIGLCTNKNIAAVDNLGKHRRETACLGWV